MHIKKLTICGFKTYGEKTVLEFSEGVNLIIGANGTGKSNLFSAIEFVLNHSDYRRLNEVQRRSLLYEEGRRRISCEYAYVEIELDNSDMRLPFDLEIVKLKRTVGTSKDRFFVNDKEESLPSISGYLEAAGFVNPYYIVKQGFVNALAQRGCAELQLKLVKEATGVRTFEEKIKKIHTENDNSVTILNETTRLMMTTLAEMIKERKKKGVEILAYLDLNKSKRAIDYVLLNHDLAGYNKRKSQIENEKRNDVDKAKSLKEQYQNVKGKRESKEIEISSKENFYKTLDCQLKQLNEQIQENIDEEVKNNQFIKYQQKEFKDKEKEVEKVKVELKQLTKQKQSIVKKRDQLQSEYNILKGEDEANQKSLSAIENKIKVILGAKRKGFGNNLEMQKWINEEKKSAHEANLKKSKSINDVKKRLNELKIKLKKHNDTIEEMQNEISFTMTHVKQFDKDIIDHKKAIASNQRKLEAKLEEISNLQHRIPGKKDDYLASSFKLKKLVGEPLIKGWIGVCEIIADLKEEMFNLDESTTEGAQRIEEIQVILNGYHGLVIDNFSCPIELRVPIESVAPRQLFYHIVKNSAIGGKILQEFNRRKKQGEVYFLPMEQLKTYKSYDSQDSSVEQEQQRKRRGGDGGNKKQKGAILKEKIQYDKEFEKVFEHLYGNTIVVPDIVNMIERDRFMNYVSLDGDKHNKNGVMTGGYNQSRLSKIEAYISIKSLESEIKKFEKDKDDLESEQVNLNRIIEEQLVKLSSIEESRASTRNAVECLLKSLVPLKFAIEPIEFDIKREENLLEKLNADKRGEVDSEMIEEINEEFEGEEDHIKIAEELLISLKVEQKDMLRIKEEVFKNFSDKQKELKEIEQEMKNLVKRKEELERFITMDQCSTDDLLKLNEAKLKQKDISTKLTLLKSQLAENSSEIGIAEEVLISTKTEAMKLKDEEDELMTQVDEQMKKVQKFEAKYYNVCAKIYEIEEKIKGLTVPEHAGKYEGSEWNKDDLLLELQEIKKKMKKREVFFGGEEENNISYLAKIHAEYEDLKVKFESLKNRRARLEFNKETIHRTIVQLEDKKTREFLESVKKLQTAFREIFTELTNNCGTANLVIVGKKPVPDPEVSLNTSVESSNSSSNGSKASSSLPDSLILRETSNITDQELIKNWSIKYLNSVEIDASFVTDSTNSQVTHYLEHLSGGQKSVVSLALILAMQKCDPVPFYLFDEVDQALDEVHRGNLASIIRNLSYPQLGVQHQFICTSFRKELVANADKIFKVYRNNLTSCVAEVNPDDAITFLQSTTNDCINSTGYSPSTGSGSINGSVNGSIRGDDETIVGRNPDIDISSEYEYNMKGGSQSQAADKEGMSTPQGPQMDLDTSDEEYHGSIASVSLTPSSTSSSHRGDKNVKSPNSSIFLTPERSGNTNSNSVASSERRENEESDSDESSTFVPKKKKNPPSTSTARSDRDEEGSDYSTPSSARHSSRRSKTASVSSRASF